MRKRNIDKHIWFSRDEAQELQKKAKKACLSEGALIRLLIRGYEPREKPDDRFYDTMRQATTSISWRCRHTRSALLTRRSFRRKRSVGTSFRQMWSECFCVPKKVS